MLKAKKKLKIPKRMFAVADNAREELEAGLN